MTYPEFMMSRCTQCKRCTEECPFGAINEDEKANPLPNITRCRRCGTCMGACPERIISFKNYSVDMIGSMIKGIEVPDADEKNPGHCLDLENDAYPALDMAGINRIPIDPFYRFIPVRCLGSVNLVWIADALARNRRVSCWVAAKVTIISATSSRAVNWPTPVWKRFPKPWAVWPWSRIGSGWKKFPSTTMTNSRSS
jgi:Pyruvate/2-oxoacid:ferredoxin oxidoreductase delta subunit